MAGFCEHGAERLASVHALNLFTATDAAVRTDY
jgi:hypothetical protein